MAGTTEGRGLDGIVAEVEAGLRSHLETDEVLGLTWLVAVGGDMRSGAIGHFDAGRSQPVATDTIFRISSMTKPVTAAAALVLVDDRVIALADPVDELLPELADRRVLSHPAAPVDDTVPAERPITVDDLLTFRLGLGGDFTDFTPKPIDEAIAKLEILTGPPAPALPPEPDEWIRRIGTVPLQYQPGERWLYHTGADVLGVLIARAAGQPLDEFIDERLFQPLGMTDTGFFVPAGQLDRFGPCFSADPESGERTVYDPRDGQWSSRPPFPGGGAGLVSTVGDFHRFADMLRHGGSWQGGRVLSDDSVRAMTANQLTDEQLRRGGPDPSGSLGWGFGVGVHVGPDRNHSVGTYGWDGGLGSIWRSDPQRDVIGILLTNQAWTSPVPPPVCDAFWATLRTVGD
jgi:CubicO group peptidase (beta-lactamase class C family)